MGSTDLTVPDLTTPTRLVRWHVLDGGRVAPGDVVCEFEVGAGTFELWAEGPGVLQRLVAAGAEVMPGQSIARLIEHAA